MKEFYVYWKGEKWKTFSLMGENISLLRKQFIGDTDYIKV